jgi:ribonuclease HI
MLKAYTDGSALNNGLAGNIGGFGYVIVDEHDHIIDAFSSPRIKNTTNNAQELLAIWAVLKKYPDEELSIYSDSYYALNSICTWMYNWAKNDWKNTASRRIENYDIITTIYIKIIAMIHIKHNICIIHIIYIFITHIIVIIQIIHIIIIIHLLKKRILFILLFI